MKSKCCNTDMNTVYGGEGTNFFECDNCGHPCDQKIEYSLVREVMSEEINARYDLVPKNNNDELKDLGHTKEDFYEVEDKNPVAIVQEWIDEGKKIGRKEALDEAIYKTMMISNQFHGGGNGRRLFVELIDILQELKK